VGAGSLVIRIHDPPKVPLGVTSVFVSYKDIFLGQTNGKAWVDIKQSGSIDLMTVVNFTQTIANVKVPSGAFNLMVMNISSVIITSNSVNYTAYVPNDQLTIPVQRGGLIVSNSTITGAVIDVSPTVIQHTVYNSTGASLISFVMIPSANAFVIPASHLGQNETQVGEREDVSSEQWLTGLINQQQNQTSFKISSAVLSNSSFILVLKNTGNSSVTVQTVFIESNITNHSGEGDLNIGRSVIFVVLSNGTLVPSNGGDSEGQLSIGYNLAANSQVALSYLGPVPPYQSTGGSDGNDSSPSSETSNSGSEDAGAVPQGATTIIQPAILDSLVTSQNTYGFQIVPGQNYIVGATSGSVTTTFVVTAS